MHANFLRERISPHAFSWFQSTWHTVSADPRFEEPAARGRPAERPWAQCSGGPHKCLNPVFRLDRWNGSRSRRRSGCLVHRKNRFFPGGNIAAQATGAWVGSRAGVEMAVSWLPHKALTVPGVVCTARDAVVGRQKRVTVRGNETSQRLLSQGTISDVDRVYGQQIKPAGRR